MKIGTYISVLPVSHDTTLVYNAWNDKFVVLRNKSACKKEDLWKLVSDSKTFDLLTDNGIFVNRDEDELGNLKKRVHDNLTEADSYQLHINPTLDCNFNCWYCYENHIKDSLMSPDTVQATIKFLKSTIINGIKAFHLSFFGGEPLIGFDHVARPLMTAAKDLCESHNVHLGVHFTTNGYLITDEMIEFFKDFDMGFQITMDGHREMHNKVRFPKGGGESYDIILRNIFRLAENAHHVIVRINYTAKNVSSLFDICDDLSKASDQAKKHFTVNFQRVWQDNDLNDEETPDKVAECMKAMYRAGISSSSSLAYNMVANPCYGDKRNYALINFDGNVFHCTARDFIPENRCGELNADGTISYLPGILERRENAKFFREKCHNCRIAPLCGGACIQKNLEVDLSADCVNGYSEADKDRFILTRFEERFMTR